MIKKIVKEILKNIYKLKIKKHSIKNDVFLDDKEAFEFLNSLYPMKNPFVDLILNKENQYDLSLIVPIYNDELYIEECLNSLIKQNTKYNYELILIDDGSTDSSLKIIKRIKEENKDKNIAIYSEENKGISIARNKGLSLAKGKYVGFIDNDDYVSSDYVEILLDNGYKYNAEYVKCGYELIRSGKTYGVINDSFALIKGKSNIDKNKYDGYIWSGIQKRTLWNNISFPVGYWYEDMITKMYLFLNTEIFLNIEDVIYFKRIHESNASKLVWNKSNIKCLDQLYLAMNLDKLNKEKTELSFLILLNEFGAMLYKRIEDLDADLKKKIFVVATTYLNREYKNYQLNKSNFISFYTHESLRHKDYKLWCLVGKLSKYDN